MNCKESGLLMSAWIDGEITPEERLKLEAHIAVCAQCSAKHERFIKTNTLLSSGKPATMPPFFETRLFERIAARNKTLGQAFDPIVIEKKLLFVFTAFSFIVSAVILNLNTTQYYNELQSYVLGSSSSITVEHTTAAASTELNYIASYLLNRSVQQEIK